MRAIYNQLCGILAVAGLLTPASFAHETSPVTLPNAYQMFMGPTEDPDRFRIFVAEPEGEKPPGGYPVIFTMDGNSNFGAMRDEIKRATNSSYAIPTLLVSIGYPEEDPWNERRDTDLTPVLAEGALPIGPWGGVMPDTGGADDTLDFIEDELLPYLHETYSLDEDHMLLTGHSFGGLFTLHTFLTRPEMFSHYSAMSPSIWFGDEVLFDEANAYLENSAEAPDDARLLLIVGQCEEIVGECDPGITSTEARDAWLLSNGKMVTNATAMIELLNVVKGDDAELHIVENEHHISVVGPSLALGLKFLLSDLSASWDAEDPSRRGR